MGRYDLVERIGAGGMGVVYRARDRGLSRDVAVKLVRVEHPAGDLGRARQRLLREAQALAQLSHPNVVSVFDVGTHGDEVFFAMELLSGRTLREVVKEGRRPAELIDLFVEAGRGLSAAHRAGLVHRDFKPSNVVVGQGGVRVLDFGLARSVRATAPRAVQALGSIDGAVTEELGPGSTADPASEDAAVDRGLVRPPTRAGEDAAAERGVERPLTRAGGMVGTPSYMAPEQLAGGRVDARSDQYSFCVALHEALFGQAPDRALFADPTRPPDPPAAPRIPARWWRAVARGLSPVPADRFPSMDELLARLARPRQRAAWIAAGGGGGLAAVALAAGLALAGGDQAAPVRCRTAAENAAGVWDERIAGSLHASLAGAPSPGARVAADRVGQLLGQYAGRWAAMRTEACEATHVRGEQSEVLLDRRMQCLERRREKLAVLIRVLRDHPDAATVDSAPAAAASLPGLGDCADARMLDPAVPAGDPAAERRRAAVQARLDEVEALSSSGQGRRALGMAREVAAEAAAVGAPALEAAALYRLGRLLSEEADQGEAEAVLRRAMSTAGRAGDPAMEASSTITLMRVIGALRGRSVEAFSLADFARAAIDRAGQRPDLSVDLHSVLGHLHLIQFEHVAALHEYERALAIQEEIRGPDDPRALALRGNMAIAMYRMGEARKGMAHMKRVVAGEKALFGAEHPKVAASIENLSTFHEMLGDHEAAVAAIEQALAINRRFFGPESRELAGNYLNLGYFLHRQRRRAESIRAYEEAIRGYEGAVDRQAGDRAKAWESLGAAHQDDGRLAEAAAAFERALAANTEDFGSDHPRLTDDLSHLGSVALALRQHERARRAFERMRVIAEKTVPGQLVWALEGLARVSIAQGRRADAERLLARAIEVAGGLPGAAMRSAGLLGVGKAFASIRRLGPAQDALERAVAVWRDAPRDAFEPDRARTRWALAVVLAMRGQRARAIELAELARQELARDPAYADDTREIGAWLAARRAR